MATACNIDIIIIEKKNKGLYNTKFFYVGENFAVDLFQDKNIADSRHFLNSMYLR